MSTETSGFWTGVLHKCTCLKTSRAKWFQHTHLSWGRPPRWTWTAGSEWPRRTKRWASGVVAAAGWTSAAPGCPGAAPGLPWPEEPAAPSHWRCWRGDSGGEESAPSSWKLSRTSHNFIKLNVTNRTKYHAAQLRLFSQQPQNCDVVAAARADY